MHSNIKNIFFQLLPCAIIFAIIAIYKMKHIALIMDGNRRWEKINNKKLYDGYKKGSEIIETIIIDILERKIPYLTIYAFSYENWQRPIREIAAIMNIGMQWLIQHSDFLMENNIKCRIIGNRDLLPYGFLNKIEEIENMTKNNTDLNFQIAISYGARDEILRACMRLSQILSKNKTHSINEENFAQLLDTYNIPDPDLLIRTGGEKRLSNYMLWQLAYTELYFLDKFWPDFNKDDLNEAINVYNKTQRRYGKI